MKLPKGDRARSEERLRELLKPGMTIHTVIRNVSSSGMSRSIDAYLLEGDRGRLVKHWLSYSVASLLDYPYDDRRECVRVSGAGMDMGFHLIYSLSSRLFPNGFRCTGKGCPSNDHNNGPYFKPDGRRKHNSGGYALKQEWL